MKDWIVFNSLQELDCWEAKKIEEFKEFYKCYEQQFLRCGIQMIMQPCFCHNKTQKYHTRRKVSGSFLAFKIKLFPSEVSYKEAKNKFMVREFISRKILSYRKSGEQIGAKFFGLKDLCLIWFLKGCLRKAGRYTDHNKGSHAAAKETFFDVLAPLVFIFRYRAEIKLNYRGHNLELYFIILIAILIILGNLIHYNAQHPSF